MADIIDFTQECRAMGLKFVLLEEGSTLPFDDQQFDIVLSNSVIEHVTVPKSQCMRTDWTEAKWRAVAHEGQREFAREIARVGRGYFVQTPHKRFPIDLHLWLPFTNWLPHSTLVRLVTFTNRFWIKTAATVDWQLLGPDEMHGFFPDGVVHIERALGIGKAVIAFRRPHSSTGTPP